MFTIIINYYWLYYIWSRNFESKIKISILETAKCLINSNCYNSVIYTVKNHLNDYINYQIYMDCKLNSQSVTVPSKLENRKKWFEQIFLVQFELIPLMNAIEMFKLAMLSKKVNRVVDSNQLS